MVRDPGLNTNEPESFFASLVPSRKQVAAGFLLILAQMLMLFLLVVGVVYTTITLLTNAGVL